MFDDFNFDNEFKKAKQKMRVFVMLRVVIIIAITIGILWAGSVLVTEIQVHGLKGVMENIWNGKK